MRSQDNDFGRGRLDDSFFARNVPHNQRESQDAADPSWNQYPAYAMGSSSRARLRLPERPARPATDHSRPTFDRSVQYSDTYQFNYPARAERYSDRWHGHHAAGPWIHRSWRRGDAYHGAPPSYFPSPYTQPVSYNTWDRGEGMSSSPEVRPHRQYHQYPREHLGEAERRPTNEAHLVGQQNSTDHRQSQQDRSTIDASMSHPRYFHDSSRPLAIRDGPRGSYLRSTKAKPSTYPAKAGPPPALPLLILDLNGTLVFRGRNRSAGAQNPTRRPYLSSFLHYCLGIRDTSFLKAEKDLSGHGSVDVDESAARYRRIEWALHQSCLDNESDSRFKGTHFQAQDSDRFADLSDTAATQRLLVWSSAQPQNVDAMVRAIFDPAQAAQLIRVWARDTLVPRRHYLSKSGSIKDLEVVWNALNHEDALLPHQGKPTGLKTDTHEGERRVIADYRDEADHAAPDGTMSDSGSDSNSGKKRPRVRSGGQKGASLISAQTAARFIRLPRLTAAQEWRESRGFGAHNTLLLDDSTDKATMQPYNHLLIPEFDADRANATRQYRERLKNHAEGKSKAGDSGTEGKGAEVPTAEGVGEAIENTKSRRALQRERANARCLLAAREIDMAYGEVSQVVSSDKSTVATSSSSTASVSKPDLEAQPDTVLLQAVGVLEHARWQQNVASWIRHGGLGSFAGMPQPGMEGKGEGGSGGGRPSTGKGSGTGRMAKRQKDEEVVHDLPLLDAKPEEKTEAFWMAEGERALRRRGIPVIF